MPDTIVWGKINHNSDVDSISRKDHMYMYSPDRNNCVVTAPGYVTQEWDNHTSEICNTSLTVNREHSVIINMLFTS